MKRTVCVGGIVLLAAIVLVAMAGVGDTALAAEKVYRWKCQVHWPTASVSYKDSAEVVVNRLKERTGGRLDIQLYAAGALVPSKEIFNAVKRGMIEIAVSPPQYYQAQVPLGAVGSGLPFNFKEVWECAYFYKWLGFENMLRDACAKHGLYYSTDKVYVTELACKKPLHTMDDFKGLKLRSSGVLQLYLTSIGAAASYIPGSEIYPSLASGVIDGAHWGAVQGNSSMGFYEICKYHLKPCLNITGTDAWLVNLEAMKKLPEDIQKILTATLDEHFWMRTNQYVYLEEKTLPQVVEKHGVAVSELLPEEYIKLQKAAMPIWDDVAKKSPDCAKAVEMLVEFNRSLGRLK